MIEEQEVTTIFRLLPVKGQPTEAVLAHTYMGLFSIRSVSDTIFAMLFLSKSPPDQLANS
jgi:hypothetical protein